MARKNKIRPPFVLLPQKVSELYMFVFLNIMYASFSFQFCCLHTCSAKLGGLSWSEKYFINLCGFARVDLLVATLRSSRKRAACAGRGEHVREGRRQSRVQAWASCLGTDRAGRCRRIRVGRLCCEPTTPCCSVKNKHVAGRYRELTCLQSSKS